MSEPYYTDDLVTLYHGDCREVTAWLEADVLVTDPPYGVDLGAQKDKRVGTGRLHKTAYAEYEDTHENLVNLVVPVIETALTRVVRGASFSGPHLQDMPKATAVGGVFVPSASARHAWGFKTFLPVLFYGKDPTLHRGARPNVIQSNAHAERNGHPCPKPIEWMRWLVNRVALPGEVVTDPFAGSGTTLFAAKESGYRAIGVELDERYCEIAAKRLAQDTLFGGDAA